MFKKIITDILLSPKAITEENIILPDGRKATIDQKRFVQITPKAATGEILFVDGGNAPVFDSPSVRVEFVRIYGATYEGLNKTSTIREEGFALIRNVAKDGKGFIEVVGQGIELDLLIPDDDKELKQGRERVTLAAAAGIVRFALECRFATKHGNECDFIVRDGSLQPNNTYEQTELEELSEKNVVGISKTNTMTTTGSSSATAMLLEHCPKGLWAYKIGRVDNADVFLVKLHEKTEYVFRMDTGKGETLPDIAANLAALSNDPVFPGYPYPLIEVDRMARVPNKELELLKMRFMIEAGSEWKKLARMARGSDAHGVLDKIS